jgi:RNA polymerase sigma factor (sigma-70 family)
VGDDMITPRHADELAHCFAAHARKLFGYACALAREDLALAEELVQAAFEAAGLAWQELRGLAEDQRHGWLRSTVADIAASSFGRDAAFRDRLADTEVRGGLADSEGHDRRADAEGRDGLGGGEGRDGLGGGEGRDGLGGGEGRDGLGGIGVRRGEVPVDRGEQDSSAADLERCWRIIREMPEREYAISLLRWQLDMKEAEIAAILGLPEKTVSAHLSRARHKLVGQPGPNHQDNRDDPGGTSS